MNKCRSGLASLLAVSALTACGGGSDEASVAVPEGATLCSVYTDSYEPILSAPTAFGEDGWEDEAKQLVDLAKQLEQLAPAEQADNATANVGYFQALADVKSASEFVPGSNDFNSYLRSSC
ncbi:MAG: hypothetical protein R2733_05860 [Acidimicrobiales bacterium]